MQKRSKSTIRRRRNRDDVETPANSTEDMETADFSPTLATSKDKPKRSHTRLPRNKSKVCNSLTLPLEKNDVPSPVANTVVEATGNCATELVCITTTESVISSIHQFAISCGQRTLPRIKAEFNHLPVPEPRQCQSYLEPENALKNRYNDVYCLDSTRVIIRWGAIDQSCMYIHASRVDYETLRSPRIISQGPLSRTCADFWRMVWQENASAIVQVCKPIENRKKKSAEYFDPVIGAEIIHGCLKVKTIQKIRDEELLISSLQVEYGSTNRIVTHIQWSNWPDCQAPVKNFQQIFLILKHIRYSTQPVVVHCSAGIGRSGTLVAMEMAIMDFAFARPVDVSQIVTSLRLRRCQSVQTFDQYLIIYKALLYYALQNAVVKKSEVATLLTAIEEHLQ